MGYMKLNWNFQRGGTGVFEKIPSVGEVWICFFFLNYIFLEIIFSLKFSKSYTCKKLFTSPNRCLWTNIHAYYYLYAKIDISVWYVITDTFDIFVQPYLPAQPCSTVFLLCSLMNIIFFCGTEQAIPSRRDESTLTLQTPQYFRYHSFMDNSYSYIHPWWKLQINLWKQLLLLQNPIFYFHFSIMDTYDPKKIFLFFYSCSFGHTEWHHYSAVFECSLVHTVLWLILFDCMSQ